MPRRLRFLSPGATVEVVTRTTMGSYLLPVSREFARIAVGILARAQEKYPVKIHAVAALSSHYHLILTIQDSEQLALFMGFVNANLAKEANRITGWQGSIWNRRYSAIEITHEEGVMQERLCYALSHSVKEGLVERVENWEGLHSGPSLMSGLPMSGVWYDRTAKFNADRSGKEIERDAWVHDLQLKLAPLPCWEHLSLGKRRTLVTEMIGEIEAAAASMRVRPVLGMTRVQSQSYQDHPRRVKRSPAPWVHAGSKKIRELYKAAYREFSELYQTASIALRKAGDVAAVFPQWSFPPALAFVRKGEDLTPAAVLATNFV